MPKYKRKSEEIVEAIQFSPYRLKELKKFLNCDILCGPSNLPLTSSQKETYKVRTMEGDIFVREGDYIIKGTPTYFYAVRPEDFEPKYELEDEDPFGSIDLSDIEPDKLR